LTASLSFDRVAICGLRNLQTTECSFSSAVNILIGGNGQGKTSILEALSIAATGRSFRTEQIREVLQHGQSAFDVTTNISEERLVRQQRLVFAEHTRHGYINGKRIPKLALYATRTPIVVFFPNDLELVTGSASARRTLLARLDLYFNPASQEDRVAYSRATRHRQLLLDRSPNDGKALLAFEAIMAERGLQVALGNARAADRLIQELNQVFAELSAHSLPLEAQFAGVDTPDVDAFCRRLFQLRNTDRTRGRATFGPHCDELHLSIGGQTARHHASQGQQRLLALAIKLSELRCIRSVRQVHPVLLLDDVVSELDRHRTVSVFDWLRNTDSQIFLSSPRDEVLRSIDFSNKEQRVFAVKHGRLCATRELG
jgi:DNA replication and repair protein RecF